VLHLQRGGLQGEGLVLGGPPSEPDLKAQPGVPGGLCQTHVCCLEDTEEVSGGSVEVDWVCWSHLEGVLVDEDVQTPLHLPGFTEEDQLLKQEELALTFPPAGPDSELILTDQLTLLLQVHLETMKTRDSGDQRQ